jgi:hypothetical protein
LWFKGGTLVLKSAKYYVHYLWQSIHNIQTMGDVFLTKPLRRGEHCWLTYWCVYKDFGVLCILWDAYSSKHLQYNIPTNIYSLAVIKIILYNVMCSGKCGMIFHSQYSWFDICLIWLTYTITLSWICIFLYLVAIIDVVIVSYRN